MKMTAYQINAHRFIDEFSQQAFLQLFSGANSGMENGPESGEHCIRFSCGGWQKISARYIRQIGHTVALREEGSNKFLFTDKELILKFVLRYYPEFKHLLETCCDKNHMIKQGRASDLVNQLAHWMTTNFSLNASFALAVSAAVLSVLYDCAGKGSHLITQTAKSALIESSEL